MLTPPCLHRVQITGALFKISSRISKRGQRIFVKSIRGRPVTRQFTSESADAAIPRVWGVSGRSSGGSALPTRSEHDRAKACQHSRIRPILSCPESKTDLAPYFCCCVVPANTLVQILLFHLFL